MSKITRFFRDAAAETSKEEAAKEFCRVLGVSFDFIQTSLEAGDKTGAMNILKAFEDSQAGTNEHAAYEALKAFIENYN